MPRIAGDFSNNQRDETMTTNESSVAVPITRPTGLNPMAWMKWLYDWVLHWAQTPYGVPALAILAFAESSFFPVPPDVLLIALCLGAPLRSFYFAAVSAVCSVVGGIVGYLIGWLLWEQVGNFFLHYVFSAHYFEQVAVLYQENAFWAVFTAGFTPIPYKVFTIAGGVFQIDFTEFMVASALSRSGRFFLVAGLIWAFGPPIKAFIDKYFNLLSITFVVLLIGGFVLIRWVL
jgi:membrane protein YqaA with SNARE-associated domain